jgi:two-component system cell cycle sensor histidine kinase/response regulator CckA
MAGMLHILRVYRGDSARILAVASELERCVKGGAKLAEQLLLFSRREPVRLRTHDLNQILEDAEVLLRRLLRETVTVDTELADEMLPIRVDRWQLEQVMMNLAVNASDAMPDGGRLVLRTGSDGHQRVWFEVEDSGHGIAEDLAEQIFEPFFTTKGPARGTGLGLSVVHGIVSQYQGSISFTSQAGQGTVFKVVLPRASVRDPVDESTGSFPAVGPPRQDQAQILLVEDDDGVRRSLTEILTELGHEVTALTSAEEALEIDWENLCDMVVTDQVLPGASGLELIGLLRAKRPDLGAILLSGYAEEESVHQLVAEGTLRFLKKPCDVRKLAREIDAVLGRGRG